MSYRSVFAPGLLAGQVIVVTGGGSGIGRCTAHELAALGARVVLIGRNADKLRAAGVAVDLEIYRGVVHEFIKMGRAIPQARMAHADAARALATALQTTGDSA